MSAGGNSLGFNITADDSQLQQVADRAEARFKQTAKSAQTAADQIKQTTATSGAGASLPISGDAEESLLRKLVAEQERPARIAALQDRLVGGSVEDRAGEAARALLAESEPEGGYPKPLASPASQTGGDGGIIGGINELPPQFTGPAVQAGQLISKFGAALGVTTAAVTALAFAGKTAKETFDNIYQATHLSGPLGTTVDIGDDNRLKEHQKFARNVSLASYATLGIDNLTEGGRNLNRRVKQNEAEDQQRRTVFGALPNISFDESQSFLKTQTTGIKEGIDAERAKVAASKILTETYIDKAQLESDPRSKREQDLLNDARAALKDRTQQELDNIDKRAAIENRRTAITAQGDFQSFLQANSGRRGAEQESAITKAIADFQAATVNLGQDDPRRKAARAQLQNTIGENTFTAGQNFLNPPAFIDSIQENFQRIQMSALNPQVLTPERQAEIQQKGTDYLASIDKTLAKFLGDNPDIKQGIVTAIKDSGGMGQ